MSYLPLFPESATEIRIKHQQSLISHFTKLKFTMKAFLIGILTLLPYLLSAVTPANNSSEGKESTKLSLYIPGFMADMGSWFVPKDKDPVLKSALKKIRSTSIVVREGAAYEAYNANNKYGRKMNKLEKQQFEELVAVATPEEQVSVQLRENKKNRIRQVVVLVDDGASSFVFLRLRCNIDMNEFKQWMQKDDFLGKKLSDKISI